MKLAQVNIATTNHRDMYQVHFNGGSITGRIVEIHNEYILMRYIRHPGFEDLRIVIDLDAITAIEEQ